MMVQVLLLMLLLLVVVFGESQLGRKASCQIRLVRKTNSNYQVVPHCQDTESAANDEDNEDGGKFLFPFRLSPFFCNFQCFTHHPFNTVCLVENW